MTVIAATLESWFTDRLGRQRQASPRTIASFSPRELTSDAMSAAKVGASYPRGGLSLAP